MRTRWRPLWVECQYLRASGVHTVASVCRTAPYYAIAAIIGRALASPDVRIIVFNNARQTSLVTQTAARALEGLITPNFTAVTHETADCSIVVNIAHWS